jgi:hypothetical protein
MPQQRPIWPPKSRRSALGKATASIGPGSDTFITLFETANIDPASAGADDEKCDICWKQLERDLKVGTDPCHPNK